MWIPICNICNKRVKATDFNVLTHFCDNCREHGEEYLQEYIQLSIQQDQKKHSRMESFRNEFLREKVLKK